MINWIVVDILWLLFLAVLDIVLVRYIAILAIKQPKAHRTVVIARAVNFGLLVSAGLGSTLVILLGTAQGTAVSSFQMYLYCSGALLIFGISAILVPLYYIYPVVTNSKTARVQGKVDYKENILVIQITDQGTFAAGAAVLLITWNCLKHRSDVTNPSLQVVLLIGAVVGGLLLVLGIHLPQLIKKIIDAWIQGGTDNDQLS
ncbi:MAG: hypothetical protein LKJ69_04810 [Lactobacillus sp.]|jgi:hypothetical protein|nr:hypothetical protein [Lactobacillus sp.]MCI2032704.1 hypothetical protein [Lactobacillus sp.]